MFNLTLGKNISREKVEEVCDNLDLSELVKEKGFDYQLGEAADKLSGGQLARIELARAILMKRPVLLPVSYTHLDVYKRQIMSNVECQTSPEHKNKVIP